MTNNEINNLFTSGYYTELMNNIKLNKGDKLKVINYGSLICCNKEKYLANNPEYPIYRTYLIETQEGNIEEYIDYDWKPELIGREFEVDYQKGLYIWTTTEEVLKFNQIEKI